MYSTYLSVFKVMAYALTAASGILGLLTEFKDKDKKITTSGRIALGGILVGFVLSSVITVLEIRNSEVDAEKHAEEIRRLQRPLDDKMTVLFAVSIRKDSKLASQFRPQLVRYFRDLIERKVQPDPSLPVMTASGEHYRSVFVIEDKKLPAVFRAKNSVLAGIFADSVMYSIELFRSATCSSVNRTTRRGDIELGFETFEGEKPDNEVRWQYAPDDDQLLMSRSMKLSIIRNTSAFTSIEDFPGSTMVVWLPFYEKAFTLQYLEINLKGASFETSGFTEIIGRGGRVADYPENVAKFKDREFHGYCHELPKQKSTQQDMGN